MTPNQIRELQDALNAVAGDLAWSFKIQVLPPDSKVMPQKEMQIVDDADNWIANEVAMVCDISPTEIGLLPKVSAAASPFAAREMAQAARVIHERIATKPTLKFITDDLRHRSSRSSAARTTCGSSSRAWSRPRTSRR